MHACMLERTAGIRQDSQRTQSTDIESEKNALEVVTQLTFRDRNTCTVNKIIGADLIHQN